MTAPEVTVSNPICVALDTPSPTDALDMARAVAGSVGAVKIGLTAFAAGGPDLVRQMTKANRVFLDLKFHDIPAQVAGAVTRIRDLGAELTTVHAAGGRAMLQAAAEAAGGEVTVLAVTVLTSLGDREVRDVGFAGDAASTVLRLVELSLSAGVGGIVCSPLEVAPIRERFGNRAAGGPYLVVPGIRPEGSDLGDQRRTLAPKGALDAGADLLVIGRPITAAADPAAAARAIAGSL